ncbi:hypothetical protein ABZ468_08150 [Streptomyces sp. NPDC005708]|uniref:hypothetical protein n=1 Tax=Streptomyces sp. NPDC005708 TaxID=3154564 RepID=UPI0033E0A013
MAFGVRRVRRAKDHFDPNKGGRDGTAGWPDWLNAAMGWGAVIAASVKYGVELAKTALTERGKTRREQLRQDGETERARIAKGTASPAPEESADQDGTPESDASTPEGAS